MDDLRMVKLLKGAEKTGIVSIELPLKPSAEAGEKLDFSWISAGFPDIICRTSELACANDSDITCEYAPHKGARRPEPASGASVASSENN
jgi:hypothetical protein